MKVAGCAVHGNLVKWWGSWRGILHERAKKYHHSAQFSCCHLGIWSSMAKCKLACKTSLECNMLTIKMFLEQLRPNTIHMLPASIFQPPFWSKKTPPKPWLFQCRGPNTGCSPFWDFQYARIDTAAGVPQFSESLLISLFIFFLFLKLDNLSWHLQIHWFFCQLKFDVECL